MFDLRKKFEKLKKKPETQEPDQSLGLPPFSSQLVIFRDRYRVAKWAIVGVAALSATSFVIQEIRVSNLTKLIGDKDYLIVPGAPEFMRIRPGLIAPESVYLFAEYAASQLSTFSYNTVESQFRAIADYMTPELKTRFLLSTERPLKMYRDLRVDQVFDSQPVKAFDLKNDGRGAKYIVKVRGQTRKYVEGSLRETVPVENINFIFRPRKIKANQPWFFEIESYSRSTPDEEEKTHALQTLQLEENKP